MEDPTVKRERPTIPARRFVRPQSVSPAATLEAVLQANAASAASKASAASESGYPTRIPKARAARAAAGVGRAVLDSDEMVEIPPQSDVRHLRDELLGAESGTWSIERADEPSLRHEAADRVHSALARGSR